jgi:proteasome lid subunit RPN8/RPN11
VNPPIVLSRVLYEQIEREGAAAWPNECCGIMFGHDAADGRRVVRRLMPVPNVYDEAERYHRFSIDGKQLIEAEKSAAAGEMVLGFYHSHPDHPARPSETDRQAAWPFYSYVIVSIVRREPAAMTSWVLDEGTGQFEEQPVQRDS